MKDARVVVYELPSALVRVVAEREGYFPVVVSDAKGTAVSVQRGGAGHIGIRGRLDAVRTQDFGGSWREPAVIVDSERDDRNPAVGLLGDGTLLVAYHWQGSYDVDGKWTPSAGRANTRLVTSEDGGSTWGQPYPLSCVELARSMDNGNTWADVTVAGLDVNETDFAFLPDGDLLAVMRTAKQGRLLIRRSADAGRTWSEPVSVTSASEHPGDLLVLSNGWVMLCYGRRHGLPGQHDGAQKCGVEGLLSFDSGHTWDGRVTLAFAEDLPVVDMGLCIRKPTSSTRSRRRLAGGDLSVGRVTCRPERSIRVARRECLRAETRRTGRTMPCARDGNPVEGHGWPQGQGGDGWIRTEMR